MSGNPPKPRDRPATPSPAARGTRPRPPMFSIKSHIILQPEFPSFLLILKGVKTAADTWGLQRGGGVRWTSNMQTHELETNYMPRSSFTGLTSTATSAGHGTVRAISSEVSDSCEIPSRCEGEHVTDRIFLTFPGDQPGSGPVRPGGSYKVFVSLSSQRGNDSSASTPCGILYTYCCGLPFPKNVTHSKPQYLWAKSRAGYLHDMKEGNGESGHWRHPWIYKAETADRKPQVQDRPGLVVQPGPVLSRVPRQYPACRRPCSRTRPLEPLEHSSSFQAT